MGTVVTWIFYDFKSIAIYKPIHSYTIKDIMPERNKVSLLMTGGKKGHTSMIQVCTNLHLKAYCSRYVRIFSYHPVG